MKDTGSAWFEHSNAHGIMSMIQNLVLKDQKQFVYFLGKAVELAEDPKMLDSKYLGLAEGLGHCVSLMNGEMYPDCPDLPLWCFKMTVGLIVHHEQAGELESAARWTFFSGILWGEIESRMRWADQAEHGRKRLKNLAQSRELHNARRSIAAAMEHSRWQTAAEEIWQRHPNWSKANVATELAKHEAFVGASSSTIRQRIKKPDKAG